MKSLFLFFLICANTTAIAGLNQYENQLVGTWRMDMYGGQYMDFVYKTNKTITVYDSKFGDMKVNITWKVDTSFSKPTLVEITHRKPKWCLLNCDKDDPIISFLDYRIVNNVLIIKPMDDPDAQQMIYVKQ